MTENTRKPGDRTEIIAEYRLLNAISKNKELFNDSRVTEDTFISPTAKSIYVAINSLYQKNIPITISSLFQEGNSIDYSITNQIVQEIFNIEKEVSTNIDDMIQALDNAHLRTSLLNKIESVKKSLNESGSLKSEEILSTLYSMDEDIINSGNTKSKLLTFSDWSDKYKEDLKQRKLGRTYTFGDPLLDSYLFKGASPGHITIIAAATNMGKSTFALSLEDNLIDKNIPSMFISSEMSAIDTFDRLMAKRLEIENKALYDPDNMDDIIEKVEQEKQNLVYNNKSFFCSETNITITRLRALIREFKQRTHEDYCLVIIDLLSGLKGFMTGPNGASTAASIEMHMNELEALAIEESIHIIGVVQLNRQSDNIKVSHVEQIESLRPTLGDVKNSNAYAEKATTLLTLFRPKYYAERYCKDDPATQAMEDILQVQVLKDRNSPAGKILKYMFDGKFFKLFPLMDDDNNSALDISY